MSLIRKIPKQAKRSTLWRSRKHCTHIRQHACVKCDTSAGIEVAHVRRGSGAGMGQKPHDYLAVALCSQCHQRQHETGEDTFWKGHNLQAIIEAFQYTSPCRREIEQHKREQSA